ncbi:MAG TPA: ABC transporter substrate-binding protein [Chloroflexota bacterium]|jgi:NitT/TauT family transport system substrate-binding protein
MARPYRGLVAVLALGACVVAACGAPSAPSVPGGAGNTSAGAGKTSVGSQVASGQPAAAVSAPTAAASQAAPPPGTLHTLQLGTLGLTGSFYPVWVAMRQGYFHEHGVQVEWNSVQVAEAITGLVSGSLDLSLASTDTALIALTKGAGLHLVADFWEQAPYDLIVRPEITSVADLRGKKVGVSTLRGGSGTTTRVMLRARGLADDEYELTATGGNPQRYVALQSGGVDAALLSDPVNFLARLDGYRVLMSFPDVMRDYAFVTTWVTDDWLASADNREALTGFLAAAIRAKAWALEPANREALLQVWMDETHSERRTVEVMYEDYVEKHPEQVDFADVQEAPLRAVEQVMHDLDDLPPLPPDSQWIDRGYTERARQLAAGR